MTKDITVSFLEKKFTRHCPIPLVSGDTGVYRLILDKSRYPDAAEAFFYAFRNDGQVIYDHIEISDDIFTYILKGNMYSIEGSMNLRVVLSDAEGALLTAGEVVFEVLGGVGDYVEDAYDGKSIEELISSLDAKADSQTDEGGLIRENTLFSADGTSQNLAGWIETASNMKKQSDDNKSGIESLKEEKADRGMLDGIDIGTINTPGIYGVSNNCTGLPEGLGDVWCGKTLIVSGGGDSYNQYLTANWYADENGEMTEHTKIYACQIYNPSGTHSYDMPWTLVYDTAIPQLTVDASFTQDGEAADARAVGYALGKKADVQNKNGGFAAGRNASCSSGTGDVDAIQLGEGTNLNERTLKIYEYLLMDKDGFIPSERFAQGSINMEKLAEDVLELINSKKQNNFKQYIVEQDASSIAFDMDKSKDYRIRIYYKNPTVRPNLYCDFRNNGAYVTDTEQSYSHTALKYGKTASNVSPTVVCTGYNEFVGYWDTDGSEEWQDGSCLIDVVFSQKNSYPVCYGTIDLVSSDVQKALSYRVMLTGRADLFSEFDGLRLRFYNSVFPAGAVVSLDEI